jgi:hypothetical protein
MQSKESIDLNMKSYEIEILAKIKGFSMRLDQFSFLSETRWMLYSEDDVVPTFYAFRPSGRLQISSDGKVKDARWSCDKNNTLHITIGASTYDFITDFIDYNLIALRFSYKRKYVILVNESKKELFRHNTARLNTYLKSTYLPGPKSSELAEPQRERPIAGFLGKKTASREPLRMKTIYHSTVRYSVSHCEYCNNKLNDAARDVFKVGNFQICAVCAEESDYVTRYNGSIPIRDTLVKMGLVY